MADIALTATQIAAVKGRDCEIVDLIAGVAITAGQAVYVDTAGKAGIADANAAGAQQFRGIALKAAAVGQACPVLKRGHVYGFTVAGLNGDVPLYLSDTAGALADGVGTMVVVAGRVQCLTDANLTKVVYIEASWPRIWA